MEEVLTGGCKSWEEETYWKHFQFTNFSQFLLPGYDHHFAMPETFFANQRKKLPERVMLKGPSGNTWEVGLTVKSGTLFFDQGWEEFVKDHLLKEHDLLVFKYNGVSQFEVMIFDGVTFCEKATSYFVKKNGGKDVENGFHLKRRLGENSSGVMMATPISHVRGSSLEKTAENDIGKVPSSQPVGRPMDNEFGKTPISRPVQDPIIWEATNIKKQKMSSDHIPDNETVKSEELSCSGKREKEQDVRNTPLSFGVVHDVPYISLRKVVTEVEKKQALLLAQEAVTLEGFYVIMKPTHVYRKFFMSIPCGWMNKHLNMLLKHPVILKMKGKTWNTKFVYQEARKSGGLSAGWRSFAGDNNLQELDICVFNPDGPFHTSMSLNVDIVRVMEEE
ncbi:B3 domain-containing protein REM16 [Linum grandiflorum]